MYAFYLLFLGFTGLAALRKEYTHVQSYYNIQVVLFHAVSWHNSRAWNAGYVDPTTKPVGHKQQPCKVLSPNQVY